MAFLCFEAQRRDRTGLEAAQADRLAGFLAIAVGSFIDPGQRGRGATISKGLFAARAAFAAGERNPAMLLAVARAESRSPNPV